MRKFLSTPLRREFFFYIFLPFLVWAMCFRSFIFGPQPEDVDPGSYAVKTVYFITHLFQGVYPLWDPAYYNGSPFEFFLRRIGDGNPFYILVGLAKAFGASDTHAYRFFLMFYYFLAVSGFWLICRRLLRHRLAYLGAYFMLLFSGWGTRVFCDYILLIFVPLVWFFYFLIAFIQDGKRHQFLGLLLALAIAMTTYIPFFFLTVVGVVVFFFVLFFTSRVPAIIRSFLDFFGKNRGFAVLACAFFIVAVSPEISFFHDSKKGEFVMPGRNVNTTEKSVLAVDMAHVRVGDLMSQAYFDRVFEDHRNLRLIDFFMPYFFFLLLLVSVINPLTRLTVFLAANMVFLGVLCVTDTSRIYAFLYQHVFVFKYMRMISFLFWMAVVPMGIVLAMRQLDLFFDHYQSRKNRLVLVFVFMAHFCFGLWALSRGGIALTSWIGVLASLVFFTAVVMGWWNARILLGILCLGIVVQPMEMVGFTARNEAPSRAELANSPAPIDHGFRFRKKDTPVSAETDARPEGGIYCGTTWYQDLAVNVPSVMKDDFTANSLYLFDNTRPAPESSREFFLMLGQKWRQQKNVALLSGDKVRPEDIRLLSGKTEPETVSAGSSSVKLVRSSVTMLELKTFLDRPRFLLWADNYHSGWHVFINGREVPLLRADHAFKGVWLPSGESRVLFRFGTPLAYLWRYFVWFCFLAALGAVVFLWASDRRCSRAGGAV